MDARPSVELWVLIAVGPRGQLEAARNYRIIIKVASGVELGTVGRRRDGVTCQIRVCY